MHPLKKLRHEHGLTQCALAKKAKISNRTIVSIETSYCIPHFFTRKKILKVLGVDFLKQQEIFDPEYIGFRTRK